MNKPWWIRYSSLLVLLGGLSLGLHTPPASAQLSLPLDYPESIYLCPAFTEADRDSHRFPFGLGLDGRRQDFDRLFEAEPYVALAMLLFAPVEGWLQSHAGRGGGSASFNFDVDALDLSVAFDELFASYRSERGFSLEAYEGFWLNVDRLIAAADAKLEGNIGVLVEFSTPVDVGPGDQGRIRVQLVQEFIDVESRTLQALEETRRVFDLFLDEPGSTSFPIMSRYGVSADARLHAFELKPVSLLQDVGPR
ncbi:hypothetical protein [Wenzhouxiangella marina]|uniref:Uncharacterized protein n=1 Tax=Wenzhouxiangella marina TaxID=1579979 RepID=A0A0K0XSN5_9GAMM|nr:hypothetical protein [Wenzhouxiangella marina]AKS40675.1 hypothetical protein WM2015_288 [Wenzhouxiangella marina]MBB6088445.1 hypothetical protein [Wenzhouxiangella marina]